MAKEYIERETLISRINGMGYHEQIKNNLLFIARMIPTADVVEVVRCKDCRWRGREDCAMFYRCECGEQHTWETDNDFCSYGEGIDT